MATKTTLALFDKRKNDREMWIAMIENMFQRVTHEIRWKRTCRDGKKLARLSHRFMSARKLKLQMSEFHELNISKTKRKRIEETVN